MEDKKRSSPSLIESVGAHGAPLHAVPKTPEERQAALREASAIDPGPEKGSWAAIQMYLITLVVCCCSGDSGFDSTVMGGINTMKQYQAYFGLTSVGSKTSIVFGIFTIGSICGMIPASYLPDKFGRRFSMFFANAVLIVGAVITAQARNKGMFLGGRFLTGLGSGCAGASAKSYLAEMAPAKSRGLFLGFLNSFYYVGQMAATGMMVPTGRWESELSWRLPLYIQAVPAGINVLFIMLCPESPRWLYSVGRKDEARQILANLHSRTKDINSPLINLEMEEIIEKIQVDGVDKRWWDFRPLFRNRGDRYRAYMVIMIGAFGQLSGNGLITYFLPVLLENAGITSQDRRLTLNFVNSVTSYIGALSGSAIIDRFGRRRILLTATAAITGILAIVTGLLSDAGELSPVRSNAGISFIYLFMVVFSFGWTPMQALYPAEVLNYEARAKGLAFLGIVTQMASLINTFGLPVALEKLTWKVYLIFLFWDVFELAMIYFFVVETKQFTLEEVGEIFDHTNPRKYSEELMKQRKAGQLEARERGANTT
ncbi:general substrate transporter [Coprinopsis sp. MPI-PUGE-AT-0042]|nr:general substrate transporter [Coprinopsis sp. MPI-PUGE-AT-0042]